MLAFILIGFPALSLLFMVWVFGFNYGDLSTELKRVSGIALGMNFAFLVLNFLLPGLRIPAWVLLIYTLPMFLVLLWLIRKYSSGKMLLTQKISLIFFEVCMLAVAWFAAFGG